MVQTEKCTYVEPYYMSKFINIVVSVGSAIVGNIFYPHGMITITNQGLASGSIVSSNVTCSFSSSYTIYETQYKCTFRENEFNYTLNPTLQYDTSGSVYSYTTSS